MKRLHIHLIFIGPFPAPTLGLALPLGPIFSFLMSFSKSFLILNWKVSGMGVGGLQYSHNASVVKPFETETVIKGYTNNLTYLDECSLQKRL